MCCKALLVASLHHRNTERTFSVPSNTENWFSLWTQFSLCLSMPKDCQAFTACQLQWQPHLLGSTALAAEKLMIPICPSEVSSFEGFLLFVSNHRILRLSTSLGPALSKGLGEGALAHCPDATRACLL